jgi:hypothetical protein
MIFFTQCRLYSRREDHSQPSLRSFANGHVGDIGNDEQLFPFAAHRAFHRTIQ